MTSDNGVIKRITSKGEPGVKPEKHNYVSVHYEGRLEDGTVFDSSFRRNKPINFPIGVGRVVKGWDIGIMSMELGEKAELTIASDYGYGDRGSARGGIPGGATMIFTVELVEIEGR